MEKDYNSANEIIPDELEIESFTQANPVSQKPHARRYAYRVNKTRLSSADPTLSREEILRSAGLVPVEEYRLRQKLHHGNFVEIHPGQIVDLRAPGVERFVANKTHVHDGLEARRDFPLPADDLNFLNSLGAEWEAINEGGTLWIIIKKIDIPDGFNTKTADMAIEVTGYPAGSLDMAYFLPAITRADGRVIPQTESPRTINGINWQRWSRHRLPGVNEWVPGIDCLESHFAYALDWFTRELQR